MTEHIYISSVFLYLTGLIFSKEICGAVCLSLCLSKFLRISELVKTLWTRMSSNRLSVFLYKISCSDSSPEVNDKPIDRAKGWIGTKRSYFCQEWFKGISYWWSDE